MGQRWNCPKHAEWDDAAAKSGTRGIDGYQEYPDCG